jgi:aminoglycoside 3-N-acetyltransferase
VVSIEGLAQAAQDARVDSGEALLIHTSKSALDQIVDGASGFVAGLRLAVGTSGTLVAPDFDYSHLRARSLSTGNEADATILPDHPYQRLAEEPRAAEALRGAVDVAEARHPVYSFVAAGREAAFLTSTAPHAFPLGSSSILEKLHQLNGRLLLVGCDHDENSLLHLSEIWADMPYARRAVEIEVEPDRWVEMAGAPGCVAGFRRIGPLLRQARIEKSVEVGSIVIRSMPVRQVVSLAIAVLQGSKDALLCHQPTCTWCQHARTFTREAERLESVGRGLQRHE